MAEFHLIGSPPLVSAVLGELCRHGARPAAPGEFTLRSFLAGRVDLVQAEAVLGVVDAQTREQLDAALDQLAGGLSRPLHELREQLLAVLAELEAGLDFAEEPIEFIARDVVQQRIDDGQRIVVAALAQLDGRDRPTEMPRVVLAGLPNAGKSTLFNALVQRYGAGEASRAVVSPTPGTTRDYVTARLVLSGVECELIDVAGEDDHQAIDAIDESAQHAAARQRRDANLRLWCTESGAATAATPAGDLAVGTKCDLDVSTRREAASARSGTLSCSGVTGSGIEQLSNELRRRLLQLNSEGGAAAATAARCSESLREAARALAAARELTHAGGDELVAAEIRHALDALGVVVGAVWADDVLDRVFSQFCIGK